MASNIEEFIRNLTDSGLMSEDEVSAFRRDLPTSEPTDNVPVLALHLIAEGRLTRYQTSALVEGRTRGLVLGEYTVLDRLGAGGMGEVYLAEHRRMRRQVAVKILPQRTIQSAEDIRRFQREVQAAATLEHPNIVTAHDAGEVEGIHFLVMQYVKGCDLSTLMHNIGPLPVDEAVSFVMQAARGLEYAHAMGVIHRDIKPSNLLLAHDGSIKILDMGLARIVTTDDQAHSLTSKGQMMGTPDYMSPEQAEDMRSVDHRADIYSLGCTLYQLVTGRTVYDGDTNFKKLIAHRERPVPSIRDVRSDVPEELDAVYQQMVHKLPEKRVQTASEVIDKLSSMTVIGAVGSFSSGSRASSLSSHSPTQTFLKSLDSDQKSNNDASGLSETFARSAVLYETDGSGEPVKETRPSKPWFGVGAVAAALAIVGILLFVFLRERTTASNPERPDNARPLQVVPPDVNDSETNPATGPSETLTQDPPVQITPDRAAAEWALGVGGNVTIAVAGERPALIVSADDLPGQSFRVIRMTIRRADIGVHDLERLRELSHLSLLDFSETRLEAGGLDGIGDLPALTDLSLYFTTVDDQSMTHVGRIASLQSLDLRGTRVTDDGLRQLTKLTMLTHLQLGDNQITTDRGLLQIKSLRSLTHLGLHNTKISDAGMLHIAELSNLEWLDLGNTVVGDEGIQRLANLVKLSSLVLSGTRVTDSGIQDLQAEIPGLQVSSE